MRAVTTDGEICEFGSEAPDAPGLDLLAVLIGSEGMFAIVTEVTVRLIPKPQVARVVMASFDDVESGGDAVAAIIAAGIIPAGLEMIDRGAARAVEEFVHAGYDTDAAAFLLCESDGTDDEVAEEIERLTRLLKESGATHVETSASEAERLRFWSGRKNAFPAAGRISPDYYCMDGTIPRRAFGRLLRRISEMEERYKLRCINVFHAGDGNIHPLILFNGNDRAEWLRAEEFGADILETCVEFGGTVTGEHGVGVEKNKLDVRAVLTRRAGYVLCDQTCLRPAAASQSGQGHPHPCTLRRIWTSACARRLAAPSRYPEVLMNDVIADSTLGPASELDAAASVAREQFISTIQEACAKGRRLCIRGGVSKDWYGASRTGDALDTRAYRGIVAYVPAELVITARSGTPLVDIEQLLSSHGQMLAFEPPHFGSGATFGGCIAAGLSGPRRMSAGAVRDFVLGASILTGRGEHLRFGGQVMKNVAGYDVARLMAGSLGTLGLLLDISVKVLPNAPASATLRQEMNASDAVRKLNDWAGQPLPITASSWHEGILTIRLEGARAAVRTACATLGGEMLANTAANVYWHSLREQHHMFFRSAAPGTKL
ncbi:FAD binding domain-containing protein [Burkholderia sp. D7]|nr:FAD binding domain-containing protein [Burkholderia sp. D7]